MNTRPYQASFRPAGAEPVPPDQWQPTLYHIADWHMRNDRRKLDWLKEFAGEHARNPEMRAWVIHEVLRDVPSMDHKGQAAAILRWVQDNVKYINERDEQLQSPLYTLKVRFGDCLPEDTLLLTSEHKLVPIAHVEAGMKIWGRDRWSEVQAVVEKGPLEVTTLQLNNGMSFQATAGHKVYVDSCKRHGPHCRSTNKWCKDREFVRLKVSELEVGDILLQPESIEYGEEEFDAKRAKVEGYYLADGWLRFGGKAWESKAYGICIAGKDGHPKEWQKAIIEELCHDLGVPTLMHDRWIEIKSPTWAKELMECGHGAANKQVRSLGWNREAAQALLSGLLADAGKNTNGGVTYSTTSKKLALQFRILQRMQGAACSERCLLEHGGLGQNPIYRVIPRVERTDGKQSKRCAIKAIVRDGTTVPCYDIQTDDHYVYLPEADVVVSNCDDLSILIYTMAASIGLPVKFVLGGFDRKTKRATTWTDDGGHVPRSMEANHIFCAMGWPVGRPTTWRVAEGSMKLPLGKAAPVYGDASDESTGWKIPWNDIILGVAQGVITGLILQFALSRREEHTRRKR